MSKTYKSGERELLFRMLNNFEAVKIQNEEILAEKQQCLRCIKSLSLGLDSDLKGKMKLVLKKLKKIEEVNVTCESQYIKRISFMSGVSERTLKNIKKEGQLNGGIWKTPGEKRGSRPKKTDIDSFDQSAIRNKINEYYQVKKEVPTLRKLLTELRDSIQFDGCKETLRKILLNMGYEFTKNTEERTVLMEKDDIAAWRSRYIREILQYRNEPIETRKSIVYVDETYIHVNYKPKKSWQGPQTSKMLENVSKGKRFIIVHAGTEKGFVDNALLVFSTKSKQADYHDDMNADNFSKWVSNKLLPNLHAPSVIVFDNSSYHSIQVNKAPNKGAKKQELRDWLTANNIQWEEKFKKAELYCLVLKHKPDPVYYIDEMLRSHGHEVLRLPPYHCHLNPIEMVWSRAKRKVGEINVNGCVSDMTRKIEYAFSTITGDHWQKYVDHVKRLEIEHERKDDIMDNSQSFVIHVSDDSDSESTGSKYEETEYLDTSSTEYEDIEYLEDD